MTGQASSPFFMSSKIQPCLRYISKSAAVNNVRQYIIDKFGIDGQRITAAGFGEEVPIAGNDTAEGRQKNRRVEAVIETQK